MRVAPARLRCRQQPVRFAELSLERLLPLRGPQRQLSGLLDLTGNIVSVEIGKRTMGFQQPLHLRLDGNLLEVSGLSDLFEDQGQFTNRGRAIAFRQLFEGWMRYGEDRSGWLF